MKQETPETIQSLPTAWKSAKMPALIRRDDTSALDEPSVHALGVALRWSTLAEPQPYLQVIQKTCTQASVEAFAVAVIDAWASCKFAHPNRWFAHAVHLAPEPASAALIRHFTQYPELIDVRFAIRAVAAADTDDGILWLHRLADHVVARAKPLRSSCRILVYHALRELAERKGSTLPAILDREVPDLGLAADGRYSVTISDARTLEIVVGPDGAMIRDQAGDTYGDFPSGRQSEDPRKVRKQGAEHRTLVRNYRTWFDLQVSRFQKGMLQGDLWPLRHLREVALRQPILQPIVSTLVWQAEGLCFRFDGDELLGVDGDPIHVDPSADARIPHPLHLDEALVQAWSEHLSDFEVFQHVDQIGRAVYRLTELELEVRWTEIPADQVVPDRGWPKSGMVSASGHFGTVTIHTPVLQAQVDGEPNEEGLRVKSVQFHAHRGASREVIRFWASEALRAIHIHAR